MGGQNQFVSGSNGNIEISSSNFHLDRSGNVNMSGKITSTEGSIGGFAITSTAISSSNDNLVLNADGGITGSKFSLTGGINTDDVFYRSTRYTIYKNDNGKLGNGSVLGQPRPVHIPLPSLTIDIVAG